MQVNAVVGAHSQLDPFSVYPGGYSDQFSGPVSGTSLPLVAFHIPNATMPPPMGLGGVPIGPTTQAPWDTYAVILPT